MGRFIYRSAIELADLISSGQATSTEIVMEHLEQIKKHNPALDAVIILLEEEAMKEAKALPGEIAAIGITNQRETTILWDKDTGIPMNNAICWQCRRSAAICDDLKAKWHEEKVREKTGLV